MILDGFPKKVLFMNLSKWGTWQEEMDPKLDAESAIGWGGRGEITFARNLKIFWLRCCVTKEKSESRLLDKAKEIWRMLKLANFRAGFTRADDLPPEDWFDDGFRDYVTGEPLTKEDVERMMDEYYMEMGLEEFMRR